jgi:hypothetical protein
VRVGSWSAPPSRLLSKSACVWRSPGYPSPTCRPALEWGAASIPKCRRRGIRILSTAGDVGDSRLPCDHPPALDTGRKHRQGDVMKTTLDLPNDLVREPTRSIGRRGRGTSKRRCGEAISSLGNKWRYASSLRCPCRPQAGSLRHGKIGQISRRCCADAGRRGRSLRPRRLLWLDHDLPFCAKDNADQKGRV